MQFIGAPAAAAHNRSGEGEALRCIRKGQMMSSQEDIAYYHRRARQERDLAGAARAKPIRALHLELAARYIAQGREAEREAAGPVVQTE